MVKHTFKNIDDRNNFIVECYRKGIKYAYHRVNSEGEYIVETEEETKDGLE